MDESLINFNMVLLLLFDNVIKLEEKVVFICIFIMGDLMGKGLYGAGKFSGDGGSGERVFYILGDG
jgi:hypothetical protein